MDVAQGFTVEGETSLRDGLAYAERHGFDFVELNMENGFASRRVDPVAVRETTSDFDVDLVVHLPYRLDTGSPHEEVRLGACRALEHAVDVALEMGANRGVFHAATLARESVWDASVIRDQYVRTVDRVASYARERGFVACVENLKGPFIDAGAFPWLIREAGGQVCLETGHAHVTGHGSDWQADFLQRYGEDIAHVHLNDTRRDAEDEHLPVGVGSFDFAPLVDAIRETGWSGTCTHEVYAPDLGPQRVGKETFDDLSRYISFTISPRRSTCIASMVSISMP